ncbi:MAG: twin transmembrane helix small protein [Burkholderiaceae bacterium]|nr:twin transmembrane helix small protein [Roseateles sp.]MBV8470951.1 twin transmembrane helix small protein [Burkholderiaceae bacterium]
MKTIIALAFVGILGALAAAGIFMLRSPGKGERGERMAKALTVRIAVSVALFLFIMLAYLMGWIHPTGIALQSR